MADIHFENNINNLLLNANRLNVEKKEGTGEIKSAEQTETTKSFGETLKESIEKVNQLQLDADQAIVDFATEKNPDIHNTMIAIQKAGVSFQIMMEVRNKILSAYEEVMRMQV